MRLILFHECANAFRKIRNRICSNVSQSRAAGEGRRMYPKMFQTYLRRQIQNAMVDKKWSWRNFRYIQLKLEWKLWRKRIICLSTHLYLCSRFERCKAIIIKTYQEGRKMLTLITKKEACRINFCISSIYHTISIYILCE